MPRPIKGSTVKHHVSIRLPAELRTAIWDFAEQRGYSVTSVLEDFLEQGLKHTLEDEARRNVRDERGVMG